MTPFFGETFISVSDLFEDPRPAVENGGLLHYYSSGSAGTDAGDYPGKGAREKGMILIVMRASISPSENVSSVQAGN